MLHFYGKYRAQLLIYRVQQKLYKTLLHLDKHRYERIVRKLRTDHRPQKQGGEVLEEKGLWSNGTNAKVGSRLTPQPSPPFCVSLSLALPQITCRSVVSLCRVISYDYTQIGDKNKERERRHRKKQSGEKNREQACITSVDKTKRRESSRPRAR